MATLIQSMRSLLAQKDPFLPNEVKRVALKELLQAYTLDYLYNHPRYRKLNFYGDTCLHIIFGLNRLSEDLDLDNSPGVNLADLDADLAAFFRSTIHYDEVNVRAQPGERNIQRILLKFPVYHELGLTSHADEALYLKVEISQHQQVAQIRKTPLLRFGRSFVCAHFSLETMMAGKMLACLERSFKIGEARASVKGRDFYDLLWFMQQRIQPLQEKLAHDGKKPYSLQSAFQGLGEMVSRLRPADLAIDLLPLFEQRSFIESWLENFKDNYWEYVKTYLPDS